MSIKGIVLAGGRSLRFGQDKALAECGGVKLLEMTVGLLQGMGLETAVITNAERDYSFLNCRIENDVLAYQGPLRGLETAYQVFPGNSFLVLTCDMPCLSKKILQRLLDARQTEDDVVLFDLNKKRLQPFPGIYGIRLAELVGNLLRCGEYSMQTFLKEVESLRQIPVSSGKESSFVNINTQDDWRELSANVTG